MTQDEIIEMAIEVYGSVHADDIKFAKLVEEKAHEEFGLPAVGILERTVARAVAKEREAFKAVCEKSRYAKQDEWRVTRSMVVTEIIEAIDARGEA